MTDTSLNFSGYRYTNASPGHAHGYLLPTIFRLLDKSNLLADQRRLLELGCGNGSVAHELTRRGWDVTGVDPSTEGIDQANRAYPDLKLHPGSAYDDLAAQYGQFPVVLSLEVVEHVYFPRQYAATVFSLLQGGVRPSCPRPTTATGRTWRSLSAAQWTGTSPPSGITANQILVHAHADRIAGGSRLPRHPLRAGRAHPAAGQGHDRDSPEADVRLECISLE